MKNKKFYFYNGFTLIESLVAIFILSIGILAVLIMFPLGIKIIDSSKMMATGIQLGQEKIEEIISLPYEAIIVGEQIETELPLPFTHYKRETRITYIDPLLTLQETNTDTGAKKVEITVSWQTSLITNRKSIELTTIISKK